MKGSLIGALVLGSFATASCPAGVLVEAEAFDDCGGWTVDQQFMDQMGSPFLLAHGLGTPVVDAVTSVKAEPGAYRLWVRTRDWCRPEAETGPGAFNVLVNGVDLGKFGVGGSGDWEWTKGPEVTVDRSPAEIRLRDGSGFEGRVDALFLGHGDERPPKTWAERRRLLGLGAPQDVSADLVVVGGGIAGLCAAVTAAREGLSVVLVQDRAVFGGNASSEVRVHVLGQIGLGPYPHNGDVLKEVLAFADRAPGDHVRDNWRLDDQRLGDWVARQRGLTAVTEVRVMSIEKTAEGALAAVVGRHVRTGRETRFAAKTFVDATGDGVVAVLAGADYRTQPETQEETGERFAPDGTRKGGDYGSSLYWFTRQADVRREFPSCPWAISVEKDEDAFLTGEMRKMPCGGWNWETGFWEDNVRDGERIRDRLFRAIYGSWDYVKNKSADRERFATAEIYWAGIVLGKRAARRVLGDYILTGQDLENNVRFDDGVVTTDWYIDLHFPHPRFERRLGREAFRSTAYDAKRDEDKVDPTRFVGGRGRIRPMAIPYRCLYSRNVPNLFLAGKDISATHVAMGSHRVMNTGGAMGTVVGRAAALCKERGCLPRQLSQGEGLAALKECLSKPLAAVVQPLWSEGRIPDFQDEQVAAPSQEVGKPGFDRMAHRMPYLEWSEPPARPNGACMILIPGGGYMRTSNRSSFRPLEKQLTDSGITCVWLWYRTPRPRGLPIYQSGWTDGQRAVRLVRAAARERGFDPERIGVLGCSAGSHLAVMLAASALTPAYEKIDALDELPCHVNWAIPLCTAYALTDGLDGENARDGDAPDVKLNPSFRFDAKTCPMCFFHGGADPYSPNGSTQLYRQLRRMRIPAELHLDPDRGRIPLDAQEFGRAIEFMRQMGYLGPVGEEVDLMTRYADDTARGGHEKQTVWPEGMMPDVQTNQCIPCLEWHFPKTPTTKAIQIIYSGGAYMKNGMGGFEVAPVRRFLNEKGMTVVTMRYRTPRPLAGLQKHVTAWQDLQRTIRLVRSQAAARGLDPDRIGIMGSSAGGHLTLLGATSSKHGVYLPIDDLDKIPCNVQWAVAVYPAYALTDGVEGVNTTGGNDDLARLVPELSFDLATCPILFIHGDADAVAAMNSVKCWEQLRRMGIQGELHTLATRKHCFQKKATPGTGSYTWMERIWEFMTKKGFNK